MEIYLKKEELVQVQIGDVVHINGSKIRLTQEFIDLNPELFEIKDKEHESLCQIKSRLESILVQKAKRDYPIDTWVKSLYNNDIDEVSGAYELSNCGDIWVGGAHHGLMIYSNGKWAEKAIFVTEDGKPVFDDDKYCFEYMGVIYNAVASEMTLSDISEISNRKRFSTHEAAQEYLDNLEPKLRLEPYVIFGDTIVKIKYGYKEIGYISLDDGILYLKEDCEVYNKWIENGCKVDSNHIIVNGHEFRLDARFSGRWITIDDWSIIDLTDFQKGKNARRIRLLSTHPNGTIVVKTI